MKIIDVNNQQTNYNTMEVCYNNLDNQMKLRDFHYLIQLYHNLISLMFLELLFIRHKLIISSFPRHKVHYTNFNKVKNTFLLGYSSCNNSK